LAQAGSRGKSACATEIATSAESGGKSMGKKEGLEKQASYPSPYISVA